MSEEGKTHAAYLAKLLKERSEAVALLKRAEKAMSTAFNFDNVDCLDGIASDIDRFLRFVEPV